MPLKISRTVANLQVRLERIDRALSSSFSRLKTDLSNTVRILLQIHSKLIEQEKRNRQLHQDIAVLQKQHAQCSSDKPNIAFLKQALKTEIMREMMQTPKLSEKPRQNKKSFGGCSVRSVDRAVSVRRTPNTTELRPLHIDLLKHLMVLQMEGNKRAVSMRELADERYPQKEYAKIKSTLSEYLKTLTDAGYVEKMQKGRLFLSYTQKALQFASDERLNRMKALISKPLQSIR